MRGSNKYMNAIMNVEALLMIFKCKNQFILIDCYCPV